MVGLIERLPFGVVLMAMSSLAMLLPAIVALGLDDHDTSRVFFYCAILFGILTLLIGFVAEASPRAETGWVQLVTLFLAYLALPAILAVPLAASTAAPDYVIAIFDMVSAMTTTGSSFFAPDALNEGQIMWRASVAWLGGFLIWVAAIAILAPLNLGGYEVTSEASVQGLQTRSAGQMRNATPSQRIARHAARLMPTYLSLTGVLWVLLIVMGEEALGGLILAMGTLSTSGIALTGLGADTGFGAEVMIFLFFFFALTRRSFTHALNPDYPRRMMRDRELRLAFGVVAVGTVVIFASHFWSAGAGGDRFSQAISALWGLLFTMMSFLTTTGFVSDHWQGAIEWSGLGATGMALIGLALMGGGVATTAGGIKLLRVYALYKHGARELGRLSHPHSVAGAGRLGRRIRREGAMIAWVFFMLLVLSLAVMMVILALFGIPFDRAMILAIAALTTTGQLAEVAGSAPIPLWDLPLAVQAVMAFGMVVGRLETLVLVALISPRFWRN